MISAMEYERSNSSDDELLPSQPGQASRGGRFSKNARAALGSEHYGRMPASDQHVRKLEKDAYVGVIRAFTAQSGAIPWSKERVMVMLRQELKISDQLHLDILEELSSNRTPSQFRGRDEQVGPMFVPGVESLPEATLPGSRKKPKSTHVSQASLARPVQKSGLATPTLSLTSAGRQTQLVGVSKGKKGRGGRQQQTGLTVESSLPSLPGSSAGEGLASGLISWVGKRVRLRLPEDNAFYEAVITEYKADKGVHALTYQDGTLEWVDLKKWAPNDLQIVDDPPISVSNKGPSSPQPPTTANPPGGRQGKAGRGSRRGGERGGQASKGPVDAFKKSAPGLPSTSEKASTPEKGLDIKGMKHFQLPSLDGLTKQIDNIAEVDDLAQVQSIKTAAMEHAKMLRNMLVEIGESSEEGDTDEEKDPPLSHAHYVGRGGEGSKHSREQHGEDDTAGDREGSDREPLAGASDADEKNRDRYDWDDR